MLNHFVSESYKEDTEGKSPCEGVFTTILNKAQVKVSFLTIKVYYWKNVSQNWEVWI